MSDDLAPRRARRPSADQLQQLSDLADRLESDGKGNKHDAALIKPWRSKHHVLIMIGTEQTNTAHQIREILKGGTG